MASSNRIVCRGCFLGHSAALLPQNLYVSPPKLPCIAAKNHLKFRRLGSFPPKFSRYWYVSQQSCIQQNVQGCAAAKFCGSNAALPLCDQKKKFVANRRISAVSHHGPYMCCDGAIWARECATKEDNWYVMHVAPSQCRDGVNTVSMQHI